MIGTMIFIVKVIYKMIPRVTLQFSFDGDHWKIDVNNRKGNVLRIVEMAGISEA